MDDNLIDQERVTLLRDDLGPDGVEVVTEIFTEDAQMLLRQIGSATTASAQEANLHRLRGGALNLGFAALAAACAKHERRAREGVMMPPADVGVLERMCSASLAALAEAAPTA
jgi:HPt (histidine-containing phosphotransfer) domain-containing protein